MNFKIVLNMLGTLLQFLGLTMILPLIVALYYNESPMPFVIGIIITEITGIFLWYRYPVKEEEWKLREVFALVSFSWLFAMIFGAIPFIMEGVTPIDAFFETMSGFTTTGATIFDDIESHSKNLLFWRCLIQWMGGMGIIVLFVAILPKLSIAGRQLFKAEASGPTDDKIKPRIRDTAKILWTVYIAISTIQFIVLYKLGMAVYDSLCHTLATVSTGGFSPYNISIAHLNNPQIDFVIIIFMFISGLNFALLYRTLYINHISLFKDEEFKFYTGTILASIILLTFILYRDISVDIFSALRFASFQIVSIITTTGYANTDFNLWSDSSKIILFAVMFIGGCAGSTSGGPTAMRVLLSLKYARWQIFKAIHPHAIKPIRFNGKKVQENIMHEIISFMFIYFLIFAISTFFITLMGVDIITSVTASISTLGNIGPGFNIIGPMHSFNGLPILAKIVLIGNMWIGRLEIFTVIVLFTPEFWKNN